MSLISFIKEAGEKLFGHGEAKAAQDAVTKDASADNVAKLNQTAGDAIKNYIASLGLKANDLTVAFDNGVVTVSGEAPDQQTREKIVLAAGNVENVASVNDTMTVTKAEPEAKYYTVVKGDTLSKIAQTQYGSANKYQQIFEANKPMLKSADLIYPGQVLRIPPAA